jgi:3-hydroxyisobutyrate dehydrogenase-like beta-hydroxyacid dehydrogenase
VTIGFIGLGNMGAAAARNLLRAGYALTVYDINPAAVAALVKDGAHAADSPAAVMAVSDITFTMVFGPTEIEDVVRGQHGFLSGPCTDKAWVDMTTSSPQLMRELGAAFEAAGGLPVDSPVTGSIDSAIRGDMILFVGGSEAAWITEASRAVPSEPQYCQCELGTEPASARQCVRASASVPVRP